MSLLLVDPLFCPLELHGAFSAQSKVWSVGPSEMCVAVSCKGSSSLFSYEAQTENDFAIVFIGSKSLSLSSGSSMKPYFR
jgi:hypothetical protein